MFLPFGINCLFLYRNKNQEKCKRRVKQVWKYLLPVEISSLEYADLVL